MLDILNLHNPIHSLLIVTHHLKPIVSLIQRSRASQIIRADRRGIRSRERTCPAGSTACRDYYCVSRRVAEGCISLDGDIAGKRLGSRNRLGSLQADPFAIHDRKCEVSCPRIHRAEFHNFACLNGQQVNRCCVFDKQSHMRQVGNRDRCFYGINNRMCLSGTARSCVGVEIVRFNLRPRQGGGDFFDPRERVFRLVGS